MRRQKYIFTRAYFNMLTREANASLVNTSTRYSTSVSPLVASYLPSENRLKYALIFANGLGILASLFS